MPSFAQPWILAAFALLPLVWLLIRALPPQPRRVQFPGVRLLLGLASAGRRPDSAPLWLRILRLAAVAIAILGFSEPLLDAQTAADPDRPTVLVLDGGWASAADWDLRQDLARDLLVRADRAGAPAALAVLAASAPVGGYFEPRSASNLLEELDALVPVPWAPDRNAWSGWLEAAVAAGAEIHWLSDGLHHGEEGAVAALARASAQVYLPARPPRALGAAVRIPEGVRIPLLRPDTAVAETLRIEARDREGRILTVAEAVLAAGEGSVEATVPVPGIVTNRIASFHISGHPGAAAVRLVGDSWQRPRIGIASAMEEGPGQALLQGTHYVRTAIEEVAETVVGEVAELVTLGVDGIVLVDRGELTAGEREQLVAWLEAGGLLIRFAGPHMANRAASAFRDAQDPLLPVRLSPGGRDLGGAFSWERPQGIRPFPAGSPFDGLAPPLAEAIVARQLLAAPDVALDERSWARLEDGTPIVTAAKRGSGEVVLFHTTATPDWTTLPLTGTFSGMLARVVRRAGTGVGGGSGEKGPWGLEVAVTGSGALAPAPAGRPPVLGERLQAGIPGADAPPGLYAAGSRRRAFAIEAAPAFARPLAPFPGGVKTAIVGTRDEIEFGPLLLALALLLVAGDAIAAAVLRGVPVRAVAVGLLVFLLHPTPPVAAQELPGAAFETTFGYVVTGDTAIDNVSRAGLRGLSNVLRARTHVEPAPPEAIDLDTADLTLYPFVYWPVSHNQPAPSEAAYHSLNRFLVNGGLLVIDTRDQGLGTEWRSDLPRLLAGMDLPPLVLAGSGHVLTQAYYLLQEFPGRWSGGRLWVAQGGGISPLVVGNSDWASAWAEDELGQPLAALGEGGGGRREMALRAGVNLVMYALTGDYKSDQVHLPAIIERLGQ